MKTIDPRKQEKGEMANLSNFSHYMSLRTTEMRRGGLL